MLNQPYLVGCSNSNQPGRHHVVPLREGSASATTATPAPRRQLSVGRAEPQQRSRETALRPDPLLQLLKARGCRNSHYTPSYIRLILKQFEPSILCVFQVIFWLLSRLKDLLNIGSANDRGDPCGKSPHVSPFLRLLVSFVPNANANANAFVF